MNSPVLWYTTRATGIVALVLLTVTMVLGTVNSNRISTARWPGFARQDLHKQISLMSVCFVAIHVLTSVLDTYVDIGWTSILVPFTSAYDRFWIALGTISVDLTLAVAISSLVRHRMNARLWRAIHWAAYVSWPVALAHTFGSGTDATQPWMIALGASAVAAVTGAVVVRIVVEVSARRRALALSRAPVLYRHLASPYELRNGDAL